MDLVEFRILAVGGILAVGIVASTLAVLTVAVTGWIGRRWRAPAARAGGGPAVAQGPNLHTGRARC